MGCDAPDEDEDDLGRKEGENEFVDWIEEENDEDNDVVMDMEDSEDEKSDFEEEENEEDEKYWEEEFQKVVSSPKAMEKLVKRSIEVSTKHYKKQLKAMQREEEAGKAAEDEYGDGDERELRGKKGKPES